MRPFRQSSTAFKFLKSRYNGGKFIKTITLKIFIEKSQGSYVTSLGLWLKSRCQVRANNIADSLSDFDLQHFRNLVRNTGVWKGPNKRLFTKVLMIEENLSIELTVAYIHFICKMIRPLYQSSTALKFKV